MQIIVAAANGWPQARPEGPSIAPQLVLAGMALVSAYGFLRQHYFMGLVVGNVFALGAIAYILLYNAFEGSFAYANWMGLIYPVVLLLLLDLRYKRCFERADT